MNENKKIPVVLFKNRGSCATPRCFLRNDTQKHFFRFPREYDRWLKWVEACGRLDLISKGPEYAVRNCRLCHLHFENKWYKVHKSRAHLHPDAVPTIFFESDCQQENITVIKSKEENIVAEKINGNTSAQKIVQVKKEAIVNEEIVKEEIVEEEIVREDIVKEEIVEEEIVKEEIVKEEIVKEEFVKEDSNASTSKQFLAIIINKVEATKPSTSTQRPAECDTQKCETLKIQKLLLKHKKLKAQNKALREKIRRLRLNKMKKPTITEEDEWTVLRKLGSRLLPHNFYKILEAQIEAKLKTKCGVRYSTDFKKFAFSLYFLSPQIYHELENFIKLPSIRSIQLLTKKSNVP